MPATSFVVHRDPEIPGGTPVFVDTRVAFQTLTEYLEHGYPRLLLDECLPRRLRRELADYDVRTAQEFGWAETKNGALLSREVDAGFSGILTKDRSLEYQQRVPTVPLAILLMRAPSNDIDDLCPLMPWCATCHRRSLPGASCDCRTSSSHITPAAADTVAEGWWSDHRAVATLQQRYTFCGPIEPNAGG